MSLHRLARFLAALFTSIIPASATILTFDDAGGGPELGLYGGLYWHNGGLVHKDTVFAGGGGSGYANGTVSGDYTGLNKFGDPLLVLGNPFDFTGAYFTAAWRNNLEVLLRGFVGDSLAYENSFLVDSSGPTWFDFGYSGITKLEIATSGGTPAGWENTSHQVAIDNFTVNVSAPLLEIPVEYQPPPVLVADNVSIRICVLLAFFGLVLLRVIVTGRPDCSRSA